jgi:hypothetical protein
MNGMLHTATSAQYSHVGLVEKARIYADWSFAYKILELEEQHENWKRVIVDGLKW